MPLKFIAIPPPFADMPLWGAAKGDLTFVISLHKDEGDIYRASVKPLGSAPFDGNRWDLGDYQTLSRAKKACNDFYSKRNN